MTDLTEAGFGPARSLDGDRAVSETVNLPLRRILLDDLPKDQHKDEPPDLGLVSTGLQRVLTLLCAVVVANVAKREVVPAGFTSRFEDAFRNPVLGKLRDFLVWSYGEGAVSNLAGLSEFLELERKNKGCLGALVSLRNRYQHPKGEDPSEVLRQVWEIASQEDLFPETFGVLVDNGVPTWVDGDARIDLPPLVIAVKKGLLIFQEIDSSRRLVFHGETRPDEDRQFQALWRELRVRDSSLRAPSEEEVRVKAHQLSTDGPAAKDLPWWMSKMMKGGPIGALVPPFDSTGFGRAIEEAFQGAATVTLRLEGSKSVPEAFAETLGLAAPPSSADLVGWSATAPLVLLVIAEELASGEFLQVLYWLAELREAGEGSRLRVLVQRNLEALKADQDALWDRLPDGLSSLLRRPSGPGLEELPSYSWPIDRRRRLFGVF